jgi:ligand-binding sensor domain-containing protein
MRFSIVFSFLLLPFILCAQPNGFRNYAIKDGLLSSEVYHVMQDSKGFMWFSTDRGVSRFDGYSFRNITTKEGLPDNTIFECIEDYKGRIWFRSFSGRLSYFYNDSVFSLPVNDSLSAYSGRSQVLDLYVDRSEKLYTVSYNGPPLVIDLRNKFHISRLSTEEGVYHLIIPDPFSALLGRWGYLPMNHGYKIEDSVYYSVHSPQKTLLPPKPFFAMCQPFGGPRHKALRLSKDSILVAFNAKLILLISNKVAAIRDFGKNILFLGRDKTGTIWIVPEQNTPVSYAGGKITQYPFLKPLEEKGITSVARSDDGGIWVTSLKGGIFYYNSFGVQSIREERINFVATSPDKKIWFGPGKQNTLDVFSNDSIAHFPVPLTPSGILMHSNGSIWIGGYRQIVVFKENQFYQLELPKSEVTQLIEDKDGRVWGLSSFIIYLFEMKGNILSVVKNFSLKSKSFSFCKNGEGGLWIGSANGLWAYSDDSLKYCGGDAPLLKSRMEDIKETANGDLWIATRDAGIVIKGKHKLMHVTEKSGLISDFCNCLYIKEDGQVWVGTVKGLSCIFESGNSEKLYTVKNVPSGNGLLSNEITQIASADGRIYLASKNGLSMFDPRRQPVAIPSTPVYITGLQINNKSVSPYSNSQLTLQHDENFIVIEYVGLNYREAGETQYLYKMDGVNKKWERTSNRSIQYPRLPPGEYVFTVKAINRDGVESSIPAQLNFIIYPPYWATWWFRTLCLLLALSLVLWRIRIVEKRGIDKAESVRQLAHMELKTLRSQLNPHFLFNSLSTLSGLIESGNQTALKFVDELSLVYRYTLQHRDKECIELSEELEYAEAYTYLLKIRFGDGFYVKWNINPLHEKWFLPTHSLQLLIENVLKHNAILPDDPLWIEISSTPADTLLVRSRLNRKRSIPESTGIGLNSLRQRYLMLTNTKIIVGEDGSTFWVELPLIKNKMQNA